MTRHTPVAAEIQPAAAISKNDDAAGIQPAASTEQLPTRLQADRTSSMSHSTTTTTASSTLAEQSIVASLTAELMIDAEDGQPTLIASTLGNAADLQVINPTGLLEMVTRQREQLDQIEALAQEYAEKVAIPALLTKHGFELEELDVASLFEDNPKVAAGFGAFAAVHNDGRSIIVVPAGQTPTVRLATIRDLILYMQEQA